MKRKLLTAALAACFSLGAFAQSYYAIKTVGTTEEYNMNTTTGVTTLISGATPGVNNTLSATQVLPFAFYFYGNLSINYKVSSSGYITFDPLQSADNTTNIALPSTSAPKAAIFAFWDNLMMQPVTQGTTTFPSDVRVFTYGTAPNRVHVIQWRLAQAQGSTGGTNVTYFAIRLYESGQFDVVHNYGFGTFSATVGCQNMAQTTGTNVGNSPNQNFGGNNGSYDNTKSDVYTFYPGPQPAIKVAAIADATADVASTNNAAGIPIAAQFMNLGSTAIASATLNYSVNGGTVVSESVNPALAASGGMAVVAGVSNNYKPTTADEGTMKNITVWLSGLNGGSLTSDTITVKVFVNKGISGTKRVLLEEGTGAWCGYCPDGHLRLKDILSANGGMVIGAVHHNADGMTNTESNTINTTYQTGYPYGMVDRVLFSDQTTVGLNRGLWAGKATLQLGVPTPLNVTIANRSYNAATRAVTYDVKVDFVDYALPGDLRVNTFIVEDKVRGPMISTTSMTWNQRNYYSSTGGAAGGASHPLYNEQPYIFGYYHNEVVTSIPSTAWGTASIISGSPAPGNSFTKNYTYTLPAQSSVADSDFPGFTGINTELQSTIAGPSRFKHYDCRIVAFVSYYDADSKKRRVLNAIEVPLAAGVNVNEVTNNTTIGGVYPNPTSGVTRVDFTVNSASTATVELMNVVGQKVMTIGQATYAAGEHSVAFDASNLKSGVYFVQVKTAEGAATHKLVISGN